MAYEAATFEAELQAVALGRGISIVPEIAPRIYSRPGVVFAAIDGVPDCEVVVARPATGPRAARNFARITRKVTSGEL